MTIIWAIGFYGLLAAYFGFPTFRNGINARLRTVQIYATGAALLARFHTLRFAYFVGLAMLADAALITVATRINYKPFLIAVFGFNALLFVVLMYAAYLLRQPLAVATARLLQLGTSLWGVPSILLPIKLAGGAVLALADISATATRATNGLARVTGGVAAYFLALTGLAWLDLEYGSNILNPFTLVVISFIGITIVVLSVTKHTSPNGKRNPGVTLSGGVAVGAALLVLGYHYRTLVSEHWLLIWQVINVRLFYWPLALCLLLTVAFAVVGIYKPTVKRSVGAVVGVGAIWLLLWPLFTKGEPGYLWTQRFIHFQFGRLHNVNTVQAKTETEGVVAGAEQAGKVPDISVVRASFDPSAKRAHSLDSEQRAWDDEASGRAANYESQVVEGYLNGWRDKFVQHRPTLVVFGHEEICSGSNTSECTDAAGSDKQDDRYKTVLQDATEGGTNGGPAGRFRSVIVRVRTDAGELTKPVETGFAAVVCKFGATQMRTNVWTWYGPLKTSQNTAGNTNGITFNKYVGDPLAISTCNAHPGSAIIPIDPNLVGNR